MRAKSSGGVNGARQGSLCSGPQCGRLSDTGAATQAGAVFGSFFPKDRQRVGIAEIISTKLNYALTILFAPEFLGPLHAGKTKGGLVSLFSDRAEMSRSSLNVVGFLRHGFRCSMWC